MPAQPVFVIGPDEKAELTIAHAASTGRDFDETLRVIDSLQLTATYEVATPANWSGSNDGNTGAAGSDEEARTRFRRAGPP